MSGIEKDLKPRGFEVAEAAVNEDANIPDFIKTYNPPFPVGRAMGNALEYMQWPAGQRPLVPFMVFIDRQGMIRAQYTGVDNAFFDEAQEKHIRDEAEKLLGGGGKPAKKTKRKAAEQ